MFSFDPNEMYHMPAFFGPISRRFVSGKYNRVTNIIVSYLTDADKLAAYIPAPFEVAELPVITVAYACNKEVDWLDEKGTNHFLAEISNPIYEGVYPTDRMDEVVAFLEK
jgi:hypothetical protein